MDAGTQARRFLLKIPPWLCYWHLPMKKAYSRLMFFSLGIPSPTETVSSNNCPEGPDTMFKKKKEREREKTAPSWNQSPGYLCVNGIHRWPNSERCSLLVRNRLRTVVHTGADFIRSDRNSECTNSRCFCS